MDKRASATNRIVATAPHFDESMTTQAQPTIGRAVELFRGGRFDEAAEICSGLLAGGQDDFEAIHLLGAVRGKQGRLDEALELFRRSMY